MNKKVKKTSDKDKRVQEILDEIKRIQSSEWSSINSAWVKTLMVDKFFNELDELEYSGIRPPKRWQQIPEGMGHPVKKKKH